MTTPNNHLIRPAGLGILCDAFYKNLKYQPNSDLPLLLRCQEPAAVRLTILTPDDCYQVKRCEECAEELRQEAARGATFEILADEIL